MASLPLPTSATATTAASSHRTSSRPLFAKPSHFHTHASPSRRRRLHVSSAADQNQNQNQTNVDTSAGKVDRRNMLLGLGGLYGASSLISTPAASAEPVLAPNFDKCGPVTDTRSGEELVGVNCCLIPEDIVDYKLPINVVPKIRPAAHRVTPEYIEKYNLAIQRMKDLPDTDPRSFKNQANIHCAYCNTAYKQGGGDDTVPLQIHNSWLFFPFHRWYLYFFERILGGLIDDPTFALPFWNWDNPKGMTIPTMFNVENSAIYDPLREPTHLTSIVDLGFTGSTDPLQLVSNNLTVMYTEMVRGNTDVYDFMGQPYRLGTPVDPGAGASERGSHTSIHVFVGDSRQPLNENMGNFYSAGRDPIFYCHHSNVDRMWALWQKLPSTTIPNKTINDPDFLNATFLFYDENGKLVRVSVKDSIDNLKMGYAYEAVDIPWLDYRPPRQTANAKINRVAAAKAPKAKSVFPLKLEKVVRFEVDKTTKGKADESLVLENITVDTSKFLKFDVFVNDEDDAPAELDKAAYAGTYAQVPHKSNNGTATSSIRLRLTDLYDDMDIDDDDTIVVTIVPRHKGPGVTIGGIKIVAN